jgi:hypothetical protein
MQTKIPVEFWAELRAQNLIEQKRAGACLNAAGPTTNRRNL